MRAWLLAGVLVLAGCSSADPPASSTATPLAAPATTDTPTQLSTTTTPPSTTTTSPPPSPSASTSSAAPSVEPQPTQVASGATHDVRVDWNATLGPFVCVFVDGRPVCSNQGLPGVPRVPLGPRSNGAAVERFGPEGILESGTLSLSWTAASDLTKELEARWTVMRGCDPRCNGVAGVETQVFTGPSPLTLDVAGFPAMLPDDFVQVLVRPAPAVDGNARGSSGQDFHLEGTLTFFD